MEQLTYPFVQIAGVKNIDEAKLLADAGIKYIGFPLYLDYHKEDIPKEKVKMIIASSKADFSPVIITYLKDADEIIKLMNFVDAGIVQLHSDISVDEIKILKSRRPDLFIIKSLIVNNNISELLEKSGKYESYCDAFITDTYDPKTGASGATGITHDWDISRKLKDKLSKPLILAGGLNHENVAEAINYVMPFGVDCHTGAEDSEGNKSPEKAKLFLKNAISAYNLNSSK